MFFWFVLIPLAVGSSAVFFISFRQMKRKKE
jgi:hypothetical protein